MLSEAVYSAFRHQFNHEPLLVRAPGRVNLIGEHTDYNQGFVLPAAIDRDVCFGVALNGTSTIRLYSVDQTESYTVAPGRQQPGAVLWANYLLGVVDEFEARGLAVPGFDCVFSGNVPAGAGLSSSAAVECGLAFALNHLLETGLDRLTLARMAQMAEHRFAGVQCGLMDQFASLFGRASHVVRLDCRSLDYQYFPFDTTNCRLVLCNSGVKHSLASSEYNTRRQECERGVAILQQYYPAVQSLRDVTLQQLQAHRAELGNVVLRRCTYVVQENQRVLTACGHLTAGNLAAFGQQMYASHAGLRDDYNVSCRELDVLVELAHQVEGVYGARMMGGGFGGCTINLVALPHVDSFIELVSQGYEQAFGRPLQTYQTTLVGGADVQPSVVRH